jgi:hypothetical protein
MSDEPLSTGRSPSGGVVDAASTAEATVPAWLAARRARASADSVGPTTPVEPVELELEVEFEGFAEADTSELDTHAPDETRQDETRQGHAHLNKTDPDEPEEDVVVPGSTVPEDMLPTPGPSRPKVRGVPDASATSVETQFNFKEPDGPRSTAKRPVPVLFTASNPVPSPLPTEELRPSVAAKSKRVAAAPVISTGNGELVPEENSLKARFVRWARSATMAGVLVSFFVHAFAVSVLAVLVIGGSDIHRTLDIFGMMSDPNDKVADIELDSTMPFDPGQDAAPLEFPDMVQMVTDEPSLFSPADSIRGAVNGTGKGSGEGGEGESMALPAVNIPKYAVTKGSFSAWTDPKDPVPGISYEIVIQFRLPSNVKTYRGSDLSGMVIGTDGYKQVIRFNRGQSFDVKDGSVQVRIRVPGAAQLVRDTIRIESKLLREKQMIEIEF